MWQWEWKGFHDTKNNCNTTPRSPMATKAFIQEQPEVRRETTCTPVRLLMETTQSLEYDRFPRKCLPSERKIHKALTAQYCSTYRCDFMAVPQVYFPFDVDFM